MAESVAAPERAVGLYLQPRLIFSSTPLLVNMYIEDWDKIACPLYGIARCPLYTYGRIYVSERYFIRDFTYCISFGTSRTVRNTVDIRISGVSAERGSTVYIHCKKWFVTLTSFEMRQNSRRHCLSLTLNSISLNAIVAYHSRL